MNSRQLFSKDTLEKIVNAQNAMKALMDDAEFREVCLQTKQTELVNPAVTFTKAAKAGAYDDTSDEEYADLLEKIQKQSDVAFKGNAKFTADYAKAWTSLNHHMVDGVSLLNEMLTIPQALETMYQIEDEFYDKKFDVEEPMFAPEPVSEAEADDDYWLDDDAEESVTVETETHVESEENFV